MYLFFLTDVVDGALYVTDYATRDVRNRDSANFVQCTGRTVGHDGNWPGAAETSLPQVRTVLGELLPDLSNLSWSGSFRMNFERCGDVAPPDGRDPSLPFGRSAIR